MTKNGLTMTLVFEAESLNYGESFGNISALKKLTRGNGETYSYISRQALRYEMVRQMGVDNTPVEASGSGEKSVIQFAPNTSIVDYPEIDLFGYMKTESNKGAATRSAVVRLSNAVALEAYQADTDFLTNMGLSSRNKDATNAIAQSEIHRSLFTYTVTVDLDRVGIDGEETVDQEERSKRVKELLRVIKFLYRDIKGRRENLAPLFVIGGVYETKSPFFMNRIKMNRSLDLLVTPLKNVLDLDADVKENTCVGYAGDVFKNSEEIQNVLEPVSLGEFFNHMEKAVEDAYQ